VHPRQPRLGRSGKVNDFGMVLRSFPFGAGIAQLFPGLGKKDDPRLVPGGIYFPPGIVHDGIHPALVPKMDRPFVGIQISENLVADLFVPPALQVDEQDTAVVIKSLGREAQFPLIKDAGGRGDIRHFQIAGRQDGRAVEGRIIEFRKIGHDDQVAIEIENAVEIGRQNERR
jgi:hypothetical protein